MTGKKRNLQNILLKLGNRALISTIAAAGFPSIGASQPQPEYGVRAPQPLYGILEPPPIAAEPIEIAASVDVFGRVIDSRTNSPIPQAQVQLFSGSTPAHLTVADENGFFHISYSGFLEKDKEYRIKATPLDGNGKERLAPADTVIKASGVRAESIKDSIVFKLSPIKSKKKK